MNSVTELATQIANELGAAEMLQGPYLDAVPIIARSLTAYSLAPTAVVSSTKEAAQEFFDGLDSDYDIPLHARAIERLAILLTARDLALTAAVRREDASEVIRCQSAPGVWADSPDAVATGILALITPEQQSALDAYRDSVLAPVRERTLEDAALILDNGHFLTRDSPERKWAIQVAAKIRALKGSSDAAKEAETEDRKK